MKKSAKGLYIREGIYYSCNANKQDTYECLVAKACKTLGVKTKKKKRVCLFKPGRGALITAHNDDGSKWTLGGYVRSLHTSMEKVVIGVGYISESDDSAKVCPFLQ